MSIFYHEMTNQLTRKVGFKGIPKIGPVLKVTTSYLLGKYGVQITIEFVNKDISHSWVRISHGFNILVTDLIDNKYDDKWETSTTKTEVFVLASRSKAKQNRQDLQVPAPFQGLYVFLKENGLTLNQKLKSIRRTQWQKE